MHAYQRVQPLTIGELWAVAITLRVVLVENLRRLAERVVDGRRQRREADALADGFVGSEAGPSESVLRRIETMRWERPFAVQLVQRLRERIPRPPPSCGGSSVASPRRARPPTSSCARSTRRRAPLNVTVRNVITSMRHISSFDWKEFFEAVSLVDAAPARGVRVRGDGLHDARPLPPRDRGPLERIGTHRDRGRDAGAEPRHRGDPPGAGLGARGPGAADPVSLQRRRDPGYWLISKGRPVLEARIGFRPAALRRLVQLYVSMGVSGYVSSVLVLTAAIASLPLVEAARGATPLPLMIAIGLLAFFTATSAAIALVNRFISGILEPRPLPKLDLEQGPPARCGPSWSCRRS